jgi:hypothetical protein
LPLTTIDDVHLNVIADGVAQAFREIRLSTAERIQASVAE